MTTQERVDATNRMALRQRMMVLRDSYLESSTAYLKAHATLARAVWDFDTDTIDREEAEAMLTEAKRYLGPTVEEVRCQP